MGNRVYYVPISIKQEAVKGTTFFSQLEQEVSRTIPQGCGFLQLVDFTGFQGLPDLTDERRRQGKDICYYGVALGGIVGDLESNSYKRPLQDWDDDWKNALLLMERNQAKKIGRRLQGGILRGEEFVRFEQDWRAKYQNRSLQETHTAVLWENRVQMIQPWDGEKPVYYIPVYRCGCQKNADWSGRLKEILSLGFLPVLESESYQSLIGKAQFWKWLQAFYGDVSHEKATSGKVQDQACVDEETFRKALDAIKVRDYKRAHIPEYPDEFFQADRGCWDLWPYVEYGPGSPPPGSGGWLDISGWQRELYARNPRQDIAKDGEWAAIDFGTWNTMVAVWQDNTVCMRRIGMQEKRTEGDEQYENATVLRFRQVDTFLEAYSNVDRVSRPDTEFDQVKVAQAAQKEFRSTILSVKNTEEVMQFQDQLKQWTNDPVRTIYAKYQGQWRELKYAALDEAAPDPVEIYAYYIGLYLNNMHQGKIYLKYLLSYSATYCKGNLDRLKKSFERGLRKSLPEEVAKDEVLMREFEVKLYMDEATAYAATALLHYREQAVAMRSCLLPVDGGMPALEEYVEAMRNGGLFYGVYDFGGGTLDYSFGRMNRCNGQDVITPLERGGASDSGCENLLEKLAYRIFSDNRDKLIGRKIRCTAPSWLTNTADNPLVGRSSAARGNTLRLIENLRKGWIGTSLDKPISFRLMDEDGAIYDTVLQGKSSVGKEANISNHDSEPQQGGSSGTKGNVNRLDLDFKCDRTEFFRQQIREGVKLFLWQFQYTAVRHNIGEENPRFIFLGGSASKSKIVREIFDEEIKKEEKDIRYYVHAPLATKYDEKRKKENPDISVPNAKSGVVYGLLTARPDSPGVRVDSQEMSFCYFQYHLGRRVPDEICFEIAGRFALLASANDLMPDVYCHIGEVPLSGRIELLYTRKPEYGFHRKADELLSAGAVSAAMISVDPSLEGICHLYCRPAKDSDTALELWLSRQDEEKIADEQKMEKFIGWLEFLPEPCVVASV